MFKLYSSAKPPRTPISVIFLSPDHVPTYIIQKKKTRVLVFQCLLPPCCFGDDNRGSAHCENLERRTTPGFLEVAC